MKEVGPAQRATFCYFVTVFGGTGAMLGEAGDIGCREAAIKNLDVGLNELTASFRVVVTVKETTVATTASPDSIPSTIGRFKKFLMLLNTQRFT